MTPIVRQLDKHPKIIESLVADPVDKKKPDWYLRILALCLCCDDAADAVTKEDLTDFVEIADFFVTKKSETLH